MIFFFGFGTSFVHPPGSQTTQLEASHFDEWNTIKQIITRFEGECHSSTVHGVMDSNSEVSPGPGPGR
jgi:hypothetical protein